jgi:hypothetical protein
LAKPTIAKTHTWQNVHLQKRKLAKEAKKQSTNGESLNQTHCSCCEKRKITNIQCYIYMGQNT